MIWEKTVQIFLRRADKKLKEHMKYATTAHDEMAEDEMKKVGYLIEKLKETESSEAEKKD